MKEPFSQELAELKDFLVKESKTLLRISRKIEPVLEAAQAHEKQAQEVIHEVAPQYEHLLDAALNALAVLALVGKDVDAASTQKMINVDLDKRLILDSYNAIKTMKESKQ